MIQKIPDNLLGVIVHIRANNIKWETKGPKRLPKEIGTIKVQSRQFQMLIKSGKIGRFVCGFR